MQAIGQADAVDIDGAFGHLKRLYDALPAMEEKGAALARARAAQELDGLAQSVRARKAQLEEAEAKVAEAQGELARAEATGRADEDELHDLNRVVMLAGMQRGYRIGPFRNAERDFERALAASPFATFEEAADAKLAPAQLEALQDEVESYQRDYAATLALCERLEAADGPEAFAASVGSAAAS